MVLRLTRRAFSSLAVGSLLGCDESSRTSAVQLPAQAASVELPKVVASASARSATSSHLLPLFRAHPFLEKRMAHLSLGQFPTPIERAERLGNEIGVPNLWIKRDDLSGVLYGGGKTRKLEFYLAEAKARAATKLVTFGGYGSNQAVATALYGRAQGFAVHLYLAPQMSSAYVQKNLYAMHRAGATIKVVRDGVGAAQVRATDEADRNAEKSVYLIPPGGSSPLGNIAFINAAFELAEQIEAGRCPKPDCIYLAMGTMGSAVGLAIGLEMLAMSTEIVAVRASSAETSSDSRFFAMAKETLGQLRELYPALPPTRIDSRRVRFQTHQLGGGYGFATRSGAAAMKVFEEFQGYSLEPTYTAKAFAALRAEAKRWEGKTVLFWNSHNSRPLDVDGVRPEDFPRELRDYLLELR